MQPAARAFNWLEPNCRATIGEAFVRGEGVMLRVELDAVDPRINGPYLTRVRIAGGKVCEWQTHRHKPVPYARVLRRASARFA